MPENESMKVLDLFSGIGGFSLGLERAGMETVAFCEIEKYPRSILKKHWPETYIHRDIRTLTKDTLWKGYVQNAIVTKLKQYSENAHISEVKIDVITAGVPCQPASHAGKQRGTEDDRWLWGEAIRTVREFAPKWVIFENVSGLLTLNNGMEFERICLDLENEGYKVQSFVIPACAVNAIHRRDRVWIVAHSQDMLRNGSEPDRENGRAQTSKSGGGDSEDVTHTIHSGLQGSEFESSSIKSPWPSRSATKQGGNAGTRAMRKSYPIPIPTQSPVCARDDGISAELAGFGINRGKYVKGYYQVSEPEKGNLGWKVLRSMWENRNIAASSPELYIHRMRDSMPEMPYEVTHGGWLVGSRINENKGLCDMWECFYSKSYEESQDLQQRLFEQIRKIERDEKMASGQIDRVARLKALGNAVVPQIPEIIGREIMGIEGQCAKLE